MTRNRLKSFLILGLGPELVSTLVGIIIGIVTYREGTAATRTLASNLLEWVININAGAVAHQLAWMIVTRVRKQQSLEGLSTIKVIWKPTVLGVFLTFVFVYLINKGYTMSADVVFMMFLQVLAICIIVHIFLFQFRFYSMHRQLMVPDADDQNQTATESIKTTGHERFIPLNINERIEKVHLDQVSHIKVEDHYCTIVYQKENSWQQWTVYGKLKTFEKKYPSQLVRINRSVLVNPAMVIKMEKSSGKHLLTLKGEPETPFSLSSSQKHLLERLIPVVE